MTTGSLDIEQPGELFAAMADRPIERLPRMTINLFSGGKHAGQQCPIQDVLIVPASAATIGNGLVMSSAVYQAAVRLVQKKSLNSPR